MSITEVKTEFHTLIDTVENPALLESLLELFKMRVNEPESKLWNSLTAKEQNEVLDAFEESEEPENLISNEAMKQKYSKWLKK